MEVAHRQIHNFEKKFARLGTEFDEKGHGTTATLAFVLGIVFGTGVWLFFLSESLVDFGAYLVFLSFFHWSEYILVSMFRLHELSANAFLINHSNEYTIAFFACMIEYIIEAIYFPSLKNNWFIYVPGILITTAGTVFRVLAQYHAKHCFTHEIAEEKREKHTLVTNGVYQYMRHPGYFGWFWWSVGTQIILANPICIAGFFYASYVFFKDRIEYEESELVKFFGNDYVEYRKKTPTHIPLIK